MEEVIPSQMAAFLALAHQFVESCIQRFGIESKGSNTRLLIETLLLRITPSNKEDRALIRNLKVLKALIDRHNSCLPKDQQEVEEKFRDTLLKCGFDANQLDNCPSNLSQKHTHEHTENSSANCVPQDDSRVPVSPSVEASSRVEALKEEGNKYFNAADYQKALLYYDKILSTPGIPNEVFVKVATHKTLALIRWDGTTKEQMRGSMKVLAKALEFDGNNSRLFYRMSQGAEWLGQLDAALIAARAAQLISPNDEIVNKQVANLMQKMVYKNAKEHLDERYRPKSEMETKEKISQQIPEFNIDAFTAAVKDLPAAFALKGHYERDFNKNYVAAAEFYQKAADAGYPEGFLNLAALYSKGDGVECNLPKAVDLLKQAVTYHPSMPGVAESYAALGMKYFMGIGVPVSVTEAKHWFQKAADWGFVDGELSMGNVYEFEGNYTAAKDIYRSAAMKGCARAYINLGDMYKFGKGVKHDLEKARKMYEKAVYYGYSLDVEKEVKSDFQNHPEFKQMSSKWEYARLQNTDSIEVSSSAEAIEDLKKRQHVSSTARSTLLGWENCHKAAKLLDEGCTDDRQMLKLFSSAIQCCSPFITFEPKYTRYLIETVGLEIVMAQGIHQPDAVVCGSFLRFPLSQLAGIGLDSCAYGLARLAVYGSDEMKEQVTSLRRIERAISLEPSNVDFWFYKARIMKSIDDYLAYLNVAPLDHYWRPRAFYCIAEQHMKKNQVVEVLKSYELGIEAEKHQLMLFQDVEYEEKNEVADYLISKQKLNRHPSLHMKVHQYCRKVLLSRHHYELKDDFAILTENGMNSFKTTIEHKRQPDPTAKSRQREYFLEDLDLTKERIYEGYIDCLILAPPMKKVGIETVFEDKKGDTFRVLIYEVSMIHVKVGQWIRLHNPYVRIALDNRPALKLTNEKCFEVLHFKKICHCCTRVESDKTGLFFACPGCQSAYYCSAECFEQHQNDFQHSIVCQYLRLNKK